MTLFINSIDTFHSLAMSEDKNYNRKRSAKSTVLTEDQKKVSIYELETVDESQTINQLSQDYKTTWLQD